ncbi:MAG: HPr(Ser) kinase/phosphatase [bacterium]|nr:HPr(Ser) kinase/phosphatase [bacterium]
MPEITVNELLGEEGKELQLELVAGEAGLTKKITTADLNRPQLGLSGFLEYFAYERIQIIGLTELTFMNTIPEKERGERFAHLFNEQTPCFVVTTDLQPPAELIELGTRNQTCILRTHLQTTRFISLLSNYLEVKFAPHTSVHGVLVDIYGVGVLLTGPSGIGKSETALELIHRGHRLVADDVVHIDRIAGNVLMGYGSEVIKYHMEIRGLGIINIRNLFGVSSVRTRKRVSLVIRLEEWVEQKEYERTGLSEKTTEILEVEVPELTIPVRPSRNISILVEVGAMDQRLKRLGYNAARDLDRMLVENITKHKVD